MYCFLDVYVNTEMQDVISISGELDRILLKGPIFRLIIFCLGIAIRRKENT